MAGGLGAGRARAGVGLPLPPTATIGQVTGRLHLGGAPDPGHALRAGARRPRRLSLRRRTQRRGGIGMKTISRSSSSSTSTAPARCRATWPRWRRSTPSRRCRSSARSAASAAASRRAGACSTSAAASGSRRCGYARLRSTDGRRHRQERGLHRRRRPPRGGRGSRGRLPHRRRGRPALARRAVRLRARRAAADLPRGLGDRGARDAAGRQAGRRARLHRAGLLDDHRRPARPSQRCGGRWRTRPTPRWSRAGYRGRFSGCWPTSGSVGSRSRPGSRCFRRTSAPRISPASGGTPPRPARCTADELAAWLAGIADLHARGRLFGTVGYFLFTARA